jgi:hypothetical protein
MLSKRYPAKFIGKTQAVEEGTSVTLALRYLAKPAGERTVTPSTFVP